MEQARPSIEQLFRSMVPLKPPDQLRNVTELLNIPEYSKAFLLGLREKYSDIEKESVSIVSCTNKQRFLNNIFSNYQNQDWKGKELIIILNNDDMDIKEWKKKAQDYSNVYIYQLPQKKTLGYCYNFAAKKAKYDYIATFDDDDYYAPHYLTDLMRAFVYSNADIVGKRAYYIYIEANKTLALRNHSEEYQYLDKNSFLDGGKKIVKRSVLNAVQYRDLSNSEDVYFCRDSIKLGFNIFAADKYNLIYLRRKDKRYHTWKETDKNLLAMCSIIACTERYKSFVTI
jgi:cellulose synthase/poly-beta-1,6-N-acetylglucosamine synthase-like glycosyltransferase